MWAPRGFFGFIGFLSSSDSRTPPVRVHAVYLRALHRLAHVANEHNRNVKSNGEDASGSYRFSSFLLPYFYLFDFLPFFIPTLTTAFSLSSLVSNNNRPIPIPALLARCSKIFFGQIVAHVNVVDARTPSLPMYNEYLKVKLPVCWRDDHRNRRTGDRHWILFMAGATPLSTVNVFHGWALRTPPNDDNPLYHHLQGSVVVTITEYVPVSPPPTVYAEHRPTENEQADEIHMLFAIDKVVGQTIATPEMRLAKYETSRWFINSRETVNNIRSRTVLEVTGQRDWWSGWSWNRSRFSRGFYAAFCNVSRRLPGENEKTVRIT